MTRKLQRLGWVAAMTLLAWAGGAHAQFDPGSAGLGGIGGPGMVPLDALEATVLEDISVGIPLAPGISINQKLAFDRNSANPTLNKTGTSLSLPGVDFTIGLTGDLSVTGKVPGVAELPNYLIPALLPAPFNKLFPFKFSGSVTPGPDSVSLTPRLRQ